ncbi:F-box protein CPR1-like [Euphorbia lathyris]|uniref:F-box protein CPR1-like n=1 Tax=Euphorbia lathyris TaxID=212925 RepID=UPI0033139CA7
MANLPQELIYEILLWFPVKSLLRFRCVSKSFCAIIGSQSFINSHFKRSSENKIHPKLIELGVHRLGNNRCIFHALDFNEDFQPELVLYKSFPSMPYPSFFSYCNGLVLLCIWPCELCLWNPSTRKYRILPAFPVNATVDFKYHNFVLGYDSTTDDFKVVAFMWKVGCGLTQVWIFELRSNCWRRIQDFPYVGYNCIKLGGNGDCFVDGSLHFICYVRGEYKSYEIVAFDVAKETFSIVHKLAFQTEGIPIHLHVLGGCLSISFFSESSEECVDIYARKKDGDGFTWTRLHSVTRQFSGEAFDLFVQGKVAYSKKGDKAFLSSKGKLCSYDFGDKTLQEIVSNSNILSVEILLCTESLVPIGSLDEEE